MQRVVAALLLSGIFIVGCSQSGVLPQNSSVTTARQMISDGHVTELKARLASF